MKPISALTGVCRITTFIIIANLLNGCSDGSGTNVTTNTTSVYTVSTTAGANGTISPGSAQVSSGGTASFTIAPDTNYHIDSVSGCNGSLSGDTYTTAAVTADCSITATFAIDTHTVTATAGANGAISPGSAVVNHGGTTSFTVTPDIGFGIAGVTGCGGVLSGNTYTTGAVTADCNVDASFVINTYPVTATAGANGTISPANVAATYGSTVNFTLTPATGYHIASVSGCGGTLSGNTYTTAAITTACGVSASFAVDTFTVSATAGSNGAISPGSATVNYGSTTSFTVTPSTGYHIDTVSGCGGSLSGNTYTTGAVTSACSVNATFAINTFTVSATAGSNGAISPGSATVNYGGTTSFTVTPNTGYHIDTVSGCGGSLSGTTYTTGTVTSACSVNATFAIDSFTVSATAGSHGAISPGSATVNYGGTTSFTVTPDADYHIDTVSGCGGSLSGTTYTTGAITAACSVNATFAINTFTVSTTAGSNGTIAPGSATVNYGGSTSFSVIPNTGYHIDTVSGCGGSLSGTTYTTGVITSACSVNATFAIDTFTVSATSGSNGAISPGSATVNYGNKTSFTVTPNTGYNIDTVSGCGGSLSGNTYTTGTITSACSVNATFVIKTFTVSATAGSNGSISPGSATVNYGGTTSFTVTPNTGYNIDTVSGCGGSLSGSTYTTGAITSSCSVNATFAIKTFTVSATAGSNGSISPGSATVNYGSTTSFTVTPNSGYHIDTLSGCSGTLSGNTYTTGAITSACSVNATFAINTFTVSATAGSNGAISPGSATVNYGGTTSFTVTPNSGYSISSVSGCGGALSGTTYTTGAITAACAVNASFVPASLSAPSVSASSGDASIVLSWPAVANATSYNIYWGTSAGISSSVFGSYTSSVSGIATNGYTITGLTNGTTYYAVVTAVAGATEGPDSNEVSAKALGVLGSACSTDTMCGSTAPLCTASQCNTVRCPITPTTEVCGDGIDNDCDGVVDNGCAAPSVPCSRNDTVVIDDASQLYVPCGAVYEKSGTQSYSNSVTVEGWLQVKPQSSGGGTLTLDSITATISGVVNGSGRGYPATNGPGGGVTGGGGSYGGKGGLGSNTGSIAGAVYGTATGIDIQPGSGGGNNLDPGSGGGSGGAMFSLTATYLSVSGAIQCDGTTGTNVDNSYGPGGGSGGGIMLTGNSTLDVSGWLFARGGKGVSTSFEAGGGGGGGRIKLFTYGSGTMTGTSNVTGGAGGTSSSASFFNGTAGAAGSYYKNY